ncbi:MAG TPA: metallophosphoesterase, partial [Chitinophagaceae bacterium]|nr:metallophosphoesterase [Chitinophagaceae bacterium]
LLFDDIKIEKEDKIYLLGDYIDRGPGSKTVIDFILELQKENYKVYTLRGNHEQLFIDSEKDDDAFDNWIINGGVSTLHSFGIFHYEELPEEYKSFFNNTEFYFDTGDFIFVHAGFNFENEDLFEDKYAMLWIRDMKVDKKRIDNKIIVHGHTPTPLREVKKSLNLVHKTGAVNIDTGCCMKDYYGYGFLSALEVSTMKLYSTKNIE